jgi:hypothetical protein
VRAFFLGMAGPAISGHNRRWHWRSTITTLWSVTIDSRRAMAVDHIRYDILTQDALRGVVRTVLMDAARNGLPGEHHFFISFDPRMEGVRLSARMREQYPEEMTIVLQHQFWDLAVLEDRFEVGLSFGGVPERVVVPFVAIQKFVDPSVQFGVQFELLEAADDPEGAAETDTARDVPDKPARPPAEHRPARGSSEMAAAAAPSDRPDVAPDKPVPNKDDGQEGAQVVRLDRFRKK